MMRNSALHRKNQPLSGWLSAIGFGRSRKATLGDPDMRHDAVLMLHYKASDAGLSHHQSPLSASLSDTGGICMSLALNASCASIYLRIVSEDT